MSDFQGMHTPTNALCTNLSRIIMNELHQSCSILRENAKDNKLKMNVDQKQVFNDIVEAV